MRAYRQQRIPGLRRGLPSPVVAVRRRALDRRSTAFIGHQRRAHEELDWLSHPHGRRIAAPRPRPPSTRPPARRARRAVCSACHGLNGVSVTDAIPNLAGQKSAYLASQLRQLKDGTRKNAVMGAIAAQLSPDDIANVAAYFASLPGASGRDARSRTSCLNWRRPASRSPKTTAAPSRCTRRSTGPTSTRCAICMPTRWRCARRAKASRCPTARCWCWSSSPPSWVPIASRSPAPTASTSPTASWPTR